MNLGLEVKLILGISKKIKDEKYTLHKIQFIVYLNLL